MSSFLNNINGFLLNNEYFCYWLKSISTILSLINYCSVVNIVFLITSDKE
jgi:hypothetical protein